MNRNLLSTVALALAALLSTVALRALPAYQMENLGRGMVAVRTGTSSVYVGWRLLGNDVAGAGFNLYRSANGGAAVKLNSSVLTTTTDYVDTAANLTQSNAYFVKPVISGVEQAASASYTLIANAPTQQYLSIPLQIPAGGTTPDGVNYTYSANDCSVGDLDGDGEYEIIVKWDPSNSKDNSQSGYTGNVFLDAYKLNGTRLWRIDLGKNIRAGAHYTQFIVYDLDGDGKAEIVCKTADGTKDGVGTIIGSATADYRNTSGYVLSGPEFMTVFNGQTGAAMATTNYIPARGNVGDWGDTYGNRLDRYNACIAYLDGVRPSVVMLRGYYTRTALVAWDWRNGQLTQRWHFDTRTINPAQPDPGMANWEHMGNHQVSVGDVDGDGKDEILFGAICINPDGTGRYTTGIGHGDAYHMGKLDPTRAGLQVYGPHEVPSLYGATGSEMHDAATGAVIFGVDGAGADVGRGCSFDIDPRTPGNENWSARGGLYSCKGVLITANRPGQMNFGVWWDADPLRELLDGTTIYKWDWINSVANVLFAPTGVSSNNGTKATPNLSADILGDWREEVVWRATDSSELRIYTTTIPATNRLYTLMHDRQYREAISWQNSAYNQPPHPSFFLGDGMSAPPTPNMYVVGGGGGNVPPTVSITSPANGATFTAPASITINATAADSDGTVSKVDFYQGSTLLGTDTTSAYSFTWSNVAAGNYSLTAVATDNLGATTTSSPIGITVNGSGPVTYQAENAVLGGGTVAESTNAGFHGTGYVNSSANGGTCQFNNADGAAGGAKTLVIRFALATGTRTGTLTVNGANQNITFNATGAWTTWTTMNVAVTLTSGTTNTIKFTSTGQDLANIDEITIQ